MRPVREADNLHHLHVPNVMKSGSLNLLESSELHRACYGTALSFILFSKFVSRYSSVTNVFPKKF